MKDYVDNSEDRSTASSTDQPCISHTFVGGQGRSGFKGNFDLIGKQVAIRKLSGNEVYRTNALLLLIKIMLFSKPHWQKNYISSFWMSKVRFWRWLIGNEILISHFVTRVFFLVIC